MGHFFNNWGDKMKFWKNGHIEEEYVSNPDGSVGAGLGALDYVNGY